LMKQCLALNYDVSVLVRNPQKLSTYPVQIIQGDLTDPSSLHLSDYDLVFHLAGSTAAAHVDDYYQHNQIATQNLVRAVQKNARSLKRFIYVSSLAAAGPATHWKQPRLESDCENPISHYGKSKLAGERAVYDLPYTIIRPPMVYGPGDKGVFILVKSVYRGFAVKFSGPCRYYSVIYVTDLVDALLQLSTHEKAAQEVFFIGNPEVYKLENLIESIKKALAKKHVMQVTLPKVLLTGVATGLDWIARKTNRVFALNRDKLSEIAASAWVCSSEKAYECSVYSKVTLDQGFYETVQWYKLQGWL
jgi:dihydroflavonol-4-reductase